MVVMVTHDSALPDIATRVIVMNDGKIREERENEDGKRFEALRQLNEGIEDLTVFESGSNSINSSMESNYQCSKSELRNPCDYEDVIVLDLNEES